MLGPPIVVSEVVLTESRVEHVQRHLVALLGTRNGHQTLVAAFLGLVYLNHTTTQVAYFIDLRTALANDGTDHIVRDENLLSQWLTWHGTTSGSCSSRRDWTGGGSLGAAHVGSWLMWCGTSVRGMGSRTIWHRSLANRGRGRLAMDVGNTIGASSGSVLLGVVTLEVVRVAVLTTGGLGDVGNYLHATRYSTSRAAATGSIGRCCRAAKSFSQLLDKSYSDVVCRNMNSVGDTNNDKGTFCRQREAGI